MIICVVGPTSVGKTKLSIMLAKKYNGVVVNADACQIYKELNIGTAKITEEEKETYRNSQIKRNPIDEKYIDFTALKEKLPEWIKLAKEEMNHD